MEDFKDGVVVGKCVGYVAIAVIVVTLSLQTAWKVLWMIF